MVIIHLTVVDLAQQAAVQHGLGDLELAGVTALEADAGFHPGLLHGLVQGAQVFERKAERLFQDQVLAGASGAHGLIQPLAWKAAQRDDMDVGVGEQVIKVVVDVDVGTML